MLFVAGCLFYTFLIFLQCFAAEFVYPHQVDKSIASSQKIGCHALR